VIRLRVDPDSATPPFDQLKQQLTALVDTGALPPGEKLPTVRALAAELGLAANTVARAYRELEAEGVVQTRGRAGTFVSGGGVDRAAREAAVAYVREARSLGLGDDEVVALVRRALG
jgi:DNA-binding transcriptional regulator YhcF (GntR family)